jgi:proton glutamate symport protein
LGLALWLQPGSGISPSIVSGLMGNAATTTINNKIPDAAGFLASLLPDNIVATLGDNTQMLQVVVLAMLIGFALSQLKNQNAAPYLSGLINEIEQVLIVLVGIIMKAAPFGVFALAATLEADWAVLKALSAYMLVVMVGLILQFVVVYGGVIRLLARRNPFKIWGNIREVLIMAFSSSSSSATLPLTFHAVKNKLKVREEVADIVLPLGTTINMDGTALYQSVAVVFMAQALHISLDFMDYVLILLTAIMASVGAAGVPGAGLATLVLILQAVGIPEAALALILVPDRLLDMCRTVVNVAGDVSASVAVEAMNPEKNHSE